MNFFENSEIIDITPVVNSALAVFPGDTSFSQNFLMDMKSGQHLTLSSITSTVHLGAHADAPNHYKSDGDSIEKRPLNYYLGLAQVIEIQRRSHARITIEDLSKKEILAARILFKTKSFPDPYKWNDDFMSLSAEVVEYLAHKGVVLVGIDTPSIDLFDDKVLQSHQAVAKFDMAILEGIVLSEVSEGLYNLIALPLALQNSDASPVRAILLREKI